MTPFKSVDQLEAEGWNTNQMSQYRQALREGFDISMRDPKLCNGFQMEEQWSALQHEVDIAGVDQSLDWAGHYPKRSDGRSFAKLDTTVWKWEQMVNQRWALLQGFDLSTLDPVRWKPMVMVEQILALQTGHDLSNLDPKQCSDGQIREQRLALQRGEQSSPTVEDSVRSGR